MILNLVRIIAKKCHLGTVRIRYFPSLVIERVPVNHTGAVDSLIKIKLSFTLFVCIYLVLLPKKANVYLLVFTLRDKRLIEMF